MHFIPQSSSCAGSKFGLQSNSDRSEGGQPIGWGVHHHLIPTCPENPPNHPIQSFDVCYVPAVGSEWEGEMVNYRCYSELMCGCVCVCVLLNVQQGNLHRRRHLPRVCKGCLMFFDLSSGAEVIDKALEVSKKMVDVLGISTAFSL